MLSVEVSPHAIRLQRLPPTKNCLHLAIHYLNPRNFVYCYMLKLHSPNVDLYNLLLLVVLVCNLPANFYTRATASKEKRKATMKALGTLSGAAKALQQKIQQQAKGATSVTTSTKPNCAAAKFGTSVVKSSVAKPSSTIPLLDSNDKQSAAAADAGVTKSQAVTGTSAALGISSYPHLSFPTCFYLSFIYPYT